MRADLTSPSLQLGEAMAELRADLRRVIELALHADSFQQASAEANSSLGRSTLAGYTNRGSTLLMV
jgi:hypothetical protein